MTRLVVAGEALVDLAPQDDGTLVPLPGGSPVNVAVGAGRLGVPVAYLGLLSTDGFGTLLADHLRDADVRLDLAPRVFAPTTLAVVHLDLRGRADYGFYLDGTSAAALRPDRLPDLPDGAALHVSFGAVGIAQEPTGETLRMLLRREAGRRLVSLDPNVRRTATPDVRLARELLDDTVTACDLVKVSDEDLSLLHPGEDPERVAARWAERGPALVVVTRGIGGAVAFGRSGRVEVEAIEVEVVDTVGAGDAFTAGLLAHLLDVGVATRRDLDDVDAGEVTAALLAAGLVAALTCTRRGADPPTRAEVDAATSR